jgi:hypothetical protein
MSLRAFRHCQVRRSPDRFARRFPNLLQIIQYHFDTLWNVFGICFPKAKCENTTLRLIQNILVNS